MEKKFKNESKLWKEKKKDSEELTILRSQLELYTRELYISSLYIK